MTSQKNFTTKNVSPLGGMPCQQLVLLLGRQQDHRRISLVPAGAGHMSGRRRVALVSSAEELGEVKEVTRERATGLLVPLVGSCFG